MCDLYIYIHLYTLHRREGRTTCTLLLRIYHPTSSGWTSIHNFGLFLSLSNIPWNLRNFPHARAKGNTMEWLVAIMGHSSSIHSFFPVTIDRLLTLRFAASTPWLPTKCNNTTRKEATARKEALKNFIEERSAQLVVVRNSNDFE